MKSESLFAMKFSSRVRLLWRNHKVTLSSGENVQSEKEIMSTQCSSSSNAICTRWVSVVEFHDQALGIGKVFGQESTVVKWNYQILDLHQVTVRQKLGVILVIMWFRNWSQQKMFFTKKGRLNWYSSMNFLLERFGWFLT